MSSRDVGAIVNAFLAYPDERRKITICRQNLWLYTKGRETREYLTVNVRWEGKPMPDANTVTIIPEISEVRWGIVGDLRFRYSDEDFDRVVRWVLDYTGTTNNYEWLRLEQLVVNGKLK